MKSSGIGGQAVIEGVMMKNGGKYAIAVRKPDGTIDVCNKTCTDASKRNLFLRLPIIRGVVAFIDSLVIGMSTLTYSASFYEEEERSGFEKKLDKATKGHADQVINTGVMILSVILALVIFMGLPYLFVEFVGSQLPDEPLYRTYLIPIGEGLIRLLIFILYIVLISQLEDIKRMFMYHGAEHKTINCIEHGRSLTVDNVRRSSKAHKRCGTSFMLNVMIISIIVFMFIPDFEIRILRLAVRLACLPVIAGISYEFSRLAGRTDNRFVNFLSKPGLLMQALTTKEPDDSMIEVAIASVNAVFDWEPFVEELKKEKRAGRSNKEENRSHGKKSEMSEKPEPETVETEKRAPITEEAFKPLEVDISQLFDIKLPEAEKPAKHQKQNREIESEETAATEEKEQDAILAALDFMFEYTGEKTVSEISDDPAVTGENKPGKKKKRK